MSLDASEQALPSGMVTFLFTDIEGSTGRWESDPESMRVALAAHDSVLRVAIEANEGRLFKHTGDGVCAAFASPRSAIEAAVTAQLVLQLPVRMGLASGDAVPESGDYFGPVLNRAARVMGAGHGGQILVAESTIALLEEPSGVELRALGTHRLRDLSDALQIFQVCRVGLSDQFPALKTVDAVPGNLPTRTTSFIGRDAEIASLVELVAEERLVTLIGVGGVGKTSLATRVGAELTDRFRDGVWLIELAPLADAAALADAVAAALGVTPQAGMSVTDSLCLALSGRELLIVLDNCEHVLDASAQLVEALLARTTSVSILSTSRESLDIAGERTWPVPPLDVDGGIASAAVSLFADRARAVSPNFVLGTPGDVNAATEICLRLDGIALAIELAAARTVSMSPEEIRDRLGDRFRLLSGKRRGLDRHQTLRQAVQWSFDLLTEDESRALESCSVFADGFDIEAAAAVNDTDDEYAMLDVLESLVRKSLVTVERVGGHTRYAMLETIRQFGKERLDETGAIDEVRRRHATYYAGRIAHFWETWDGPAQRVAMDWVDAEFANLRTAFQWGSEEGDLPLSTTIAAHAAIMVWPLQRFEPVGWAETILERARGADLPQLPRLLVAASLCLYDGRPDLGVRYAQEAAALEADGRHDPFVDGWSGLLEALSHLFGGRLERRIEICSDLATRQGFARVIGLCGLTWALPAVGRHEEAMAIADETLQAAREYASPFWVGWALGGYGRAYAEVEPVRALEALREGLHYAQEHRLPFWEANLAQDAARLEAVHGDLDVALALFGRGIDSFHRAGNIAFLAATLASLAVFFDRFERPEVAATVYGASTRQASIGLVPDLPEAVRHLRETLGGTAFDACVATGVEQETSEAVRYAHSQILLARRELTNVS